MFSFKDFYGQRYFTRNGEDEKKKKGQLMERAAKRLLTMKRWHNHPQQSSACISVSEKDSELGKRVKDDS